MHRLFGKWRHAAWGQFRPSLNRFYCFDPIVFGSDPLVEGLLRIVTNLPRRKRRVLLASLDFMTLLATLWGLLSLRYWAVFVPTSIEQTLMIVAGPVLTVAVFLAFRVYQIVARYLGLFGGFRLGACVAISAAIWSTFLFFAGQHGVPRSVVLIYIPIGTAAVVLLRLLAATLLRTFGINVRRRWIASQASIPVIIFGVGEMAVQVGQAISRSKTRKLVGYIDDKDTMAGRYIGGHKVYRPDRIPSLVEAYGAEEVYVADTRQSAGERRQLLAQLEQLNLRVRVLPDLESLALGRINLAQLRSVEGRDLLGREEVPPDRLLIAKAIKGKSIMVTGAGGSIGSHIALHALRFQPRRLVILEQSEFAIFKIESQCLAVMAEMESPPELIKVLGSVGDADLVNEVLHCNDVNVVFHAAAYKHVPIVEAHPIAGIANNVLATESLARICMEQGVERFVLISSDKAVRPTNVMGATKRVAELVVQSLASETSSTVFTCVRFGNVLESSGSVFGLFRDQILAGGPVTVTDPNMVRYFMSLGEATNLVLQAAGMANGGEIFVLDMGEPVRVADFARSMIRLMGYDERTNDNPEGDIEIKYIGLRAGEKLVEELVLSEHSITGTRHPRIWRSHEPIFDAHILGAELQSLKSAAAGRDTAHALSILERVVDGYYASRAIRGELTANGKFVLH